MKLIISELVHLITKKQARNITILMKFILVLAVMVSIYSILFHFLMIYEKREFSWVTGFYWTLTVMSTLGFGDITFASDLGKVFSIIVLLSGIVFLMTMLPFTFIQFFYLPWLDAQAKAGAPRKLPEGTTGHVILTNYDPVTINLAGRFRQYRQAYVIVVEDVQKALELQDLDFKVAVGPLTDTDTYHRLNVENAALVLANVDDMINTNIAFTVREITKQVPIASNADQKDSIDILEMAGSTYVFQFTAMLGQSLARRVVGTTTSANVIGKIESLLIAEAPAMRTPLVGQTISQSRLRDRFGINVLGVWERGQFNLPSAQTMIHSTTVLLLAGSAHQFSTYDQHFGRDATSHSPVLILGGGRVGLAAANLLSERGIDYRIIEKNPNQIGSDRFILGNAADINILRKAGIDEAPSIIITTHDDAINIYLTIYCRRLNPDLQIVCRANQARNISKLHTAGADLVMSYASMAANTIINLLKPDEILMLAEGLNIFRVAAPPSYIGRSLADTQIQTRTECNVVAVCGEGSACINPGPTYQFEEGNELILIGSTEAEKRFFKMHSDMSKLSI